jgi:ATP-dependent Clp endopeptidase proteolytic subunit ClpP
LRCDDVYRRSWRALESREARVGAKATRGAAEAALPNGLAIHAAVADEPVEILLYDEIGYWGVTAKDFALALADVGADKPIRLRINSPGGDVFDGLAIYNALQAHKGAVVCVVDGVAASIASVIACAGATLEMAEPSMLMIHNAWVVVVGDKRDMAAMVEVMAKVDGQLAAIYASKSGKPAAEIVGMMDAETWLTSAEAIEAGFCDKASATAATAQARLARAARSGSGALCASRARALRRLRLAEAEDA